MAHANGKNEFDAAKAIVETLTGLQRPQQERALRFASETLGLTNPLSTAHLPSSSAAMQGQLPVSQAAQRTDGRPTDIKQFTESKAPKSDQQFAAVVAYYYQFEAPEAQRKATINAGALADAARLANRKRPSRHALANAKRSGYLDAAGSGEYKVNTVGENLVAITLPGSAGENSTARTKRKTRKTSRPKSRAKKGMKK